MSCLVISNKQLGDIILHEPLFEKLSEEYNCPVSVHSKPLIEPLFELMPHSRYIDSTRQRFRRSFVLEPGSKANFKNLKFNSNCKTLLLPTLDYKKWYHPYLLDQIVIRECHTYKAHYLLNTFFPEAPLRLPNLNQPCSSWGSKLDLPKSYILIHTTSAWRVKCWSPQKWAKVIDFFYSKNENIILTSGPSEWEIQHVKEICESCQSSPFNLAGQTSLKQLLYLVSRSKSTLSVDGAVAHMRTAFSIPGIVIFGLTNHTEWYYDDGISHCFHPPKDHPEKKHCQYLDSEEVIQTFQKLSETAF